jgi:acetyl esterase
MTNVTNQMQEVLDAFAELSPLPIESLTPEVARQLPELRDAVLAVINRHGTKRLIAGVVENVQGIEHTLIPTVEGQLLARIYRPSNKPDLPVILYFHGGGFVIANLNSYDASCRSLCNAADAIVVSVAYRQAPEHQFPAAHDDAFDAYEWLLENAYSIGGDVNRIAVAGESAGGNLATSVCIQAKAKGLPQPVHQLLVYPVVDNRMDTPSYIENVDAKPLNRDMLKWFFKHYIGDREIPDSRATPLKRDDLRGLAPATVLTAEIDPLCSEGESYAEKLRSFGVPVFQKRYEKVTHEFFGMGAVVAEAKEAVQDAAKQLRDAFGGTFSGRRAV